MAAVSTRLFADASRLAALTASLREEATTSEGSFQPAITRKAAALQRAGHVSDRLFAEAERQETRARALEGAAARDAAAAPHDPAFEGKGDAAVYGAAAALPSGEVDSILRRYCDVLTCVR